MTEIFDALEICLQEMERGADLDSVLARFPEHAGELRPMLKTASQARSMVSAEPSPKVVRRSRAKVMQRAADLREAKAAPRARVIPAFSRLAISFALTALLLASGAGLVNASASALPGENLYPVKRGWESLRLIFIFDTQLREMLEDEYENERLHEVNELIADGRHEVIQFAGVYMQVNDVDYVSGLKVILPPGIPAPANGDAVIVTGQTNARGFIEITSIEILPEGSVVPLGSPIEVEVESETESAEGNANDGEAGPRSGGEAGESQSVVYELSGILQVVSDTSLVINGMTIILDQTYFEGGICVGMEVEVKGYYAEDGSFVAQEVKGEGQCPENPSTGGANENPATNSDSNSNDDDANENTGFTGNSNGDDSGGEDNSNSDDDSNDNDDDDDNSGSGGDDNDDD